MAINGGSIYYNVGIDRRSLQQVIQGIRELAASAEESQDAIFHSRAVLNEFGNEAGTLTKRINTLTKDFRRGMVGPEEYAVEMVSLGAKAEGLAATLNEVRPQLEMNSSLYKKASATADSYAGSIKSAENALDVFTNTTKSTKQALEDFRNIASRIQSDADTLTNKWNSSDLALEKYVEEMRKLDTEAMQAAQALKTLGESTQMTSSEQRAASEAANRLSQANTKITNAVGGMRGEYSTLGATFTEAETKLSMLNAQTRQAAKEFDAGTVNAKQYAARLNELGLIFQGVQADISQMTTGLNLNSKSLQRVGAASNQAQRGLTAVAKGTTRATGAMTKLQLNGQLAYGGMTLLNDRIFQMSPALGILTNQLMFTTQGFKAWLTSALPIIAVAGTIIALVGTMVASLRAGTGLETALTNVAKTTNLADDELRQITRTFQGLASELPVTTMEFLEIAQVAGQLGITGVQNIEKFTETVAKLSIATNVTGEQGATSLARFLQATGTEMENMGREAVRVANVLNELENTTAATADEILQMSSYTQGLAIQANFTTAEVLGLNSTLLGLGVKAEAGGSAVVRTMSKIQAAASEGGSAIAAFAEEANMTTEAFTYLVKTSPVDALLALTAGMNDSADAGGDLNDILTDLGIKEVRERRTLLTLAAGYDTFARSMGIATDQAITMNSINAEVERQASTLESRVKVLGNQFITVGQRIGETLVPGMKILVNLLISLTQNTSLLSAAVVALTTYIGGRGLLAIIPMLRAGIGSLTASIRAAQVATTGWATAMAIANPILTAITVVLAGAAYFYSRNATKAAELEEANRKLAEGVDLARASLDAVTDVNQLELAFDAISRNLEGEYRDAWDKYTAGIDLTKVEAQDLIRVIDEAMAKLNELALSPLIAARASASTAFVSSLGDQLPGELRNALPFFRSDDLDSLKALRDALSEGSFWGVEDAGAFVLPINWGQVMDDLDRLIEVNQEIADVRAALKIQRDALARNGDGNNDPPPPEVDKVDQIAAAWGRLAATRAEIAEKAKVYGWDEQRQAEELAGAVSSAIDTLIGLGVRLDSASFASLVAEWENLNDGIITAATSLSEFERRQLALQSALERRFSGQSGIDFTIAAVSTSARSFVEAVQLLERAGFEVDKKLLDLVSTLRNETIPAMYATHEGVEEAGKGFDDLKPKADRAAESYDGLTTSVEQYVEALEASGIGRARVGGYSADREDAGQAAMPNWLQAAAAARAEELERVNNATAEYANELRQLEALYAAGLIDHEEYLNQQIGARNTMMRVLATSTIDYTARMAVLRDETKKLTADLEELVAVQKKYNTEAEKTGGGKSSKDGFGDSVVRGTQATRDQAQAIEDLRQANLDYEEGLAELDAQLSLGLITSQEHLSGQLDLAEAKLVAVAEATGWYSRTTADAAAAVKALRIQLEKYNEEADKTEGVKSDKDGISDSVVRATQAARDYEKGLAELDAQLSLGLITSQQHLSGQLALAQVRLAAVAEATGWYSAATAEAAEEVKRLLLQVEKYNREADRSSKTGGAKSDEDRIGDSVVRAIQPTLDLADAMAGYAFELEKINAMEAMGLMSGEEADEERLAAAEGYLDEMIRQTGLYSEETLEAVAAVKALREEQLLLSGANPISDMFDRIAGSTTGTISKIASAGSEIAKLFKQAKDGSITTTEAVAGVANALASTFDGFKSPANDALGIFVEIGAGIADMIVPGLGAAVSAVGQLINKMLDLSNGAAQVAAAFEEWGENAEFLSEATVNSFRDMEGMIETVSRGGILGWLGLTKQQVNEELFDLVQDIAESVANALAGGLSAGIRAALVGEQDWKKTLHDNMMEALMNTIIDAFIQTAIFNAEFQAFIQEFTRLLATGAVVDAVDYLRENIGPVIAEAEAAVEEFADAVGDTFGDLGDDEVDSPSAGTSISAVTGPTRDLLIDLLRPLSVMPSWTGMIQDIRNDVRSMATAGGFAPPSSNGSNVGAAAARAASGGTTIILNNATISTMATDAKQLFDDISAFAYRDRRGGR